MLSSSEDAYIQLRDLLKDNPRVIVEYHSQEDKVMLQGKTSIIILSYDPDLNQLVDIQAKVAGYDFEPPQLPKTAPVQFSGQIEFASVDIKKNIPIPLQKQIKITAQEQILQWKLLIRQFDSSIHPLLYGYVVKMDKQYAYWQILPVIKHDNGLFVLKGRNESYRIYEDATTFVLLDQDIVENSPLAPV